MSEYDVSMIFRTENNYTVVDFLHQNWRSNSFDYRHTSRPNWGVLFVLRGKIEFVFDTGRVTIDAGDWVFLPKGSYYESVIDNSSGMTQDYLLNFEIQSPLMRLFPKHPIKFFHSKHPKYNEYFKKFLELKIVEELDSLSAKSCFYGMLDHILRDISAAEMDEKDLVLAKAKELLCAPNDVSIAQIAKDCGVSESGLRSRFKKVLGISPLQYRLNVKINKAKVFLESSDMSVCDIADTLNFYDEAYFCKIFRKRVGCSPKKFSASRKI